MSSPAAGPSPSATAGGVSTPTTDIVAGPGGVMTDEVGVITGELTLRSELAGDQVTVHVQYKDADEWYAVTGAHGTLRDPRDIDAVQGIVAGILNRPEG